jgi:hypothetical protein
MAEELPDPSLQEARPVSRRGKGKAKTTTNDEAGLHIMNQDVGAAEASTSRTEQQTKERKKPRKLERRSVVIEEPAVTLDTRVEFLENQMQALSTRMDTVEVRQVRRPIASSYRRSSSNSTRAASSARPRKRITSPRPHSGNIPRPSLAEQLRESQRLRRTAQRHKSNESIEEVPRSSLTTASASRQVALTGQYNIPLPSNLSTEDILNLKSGMAAAGSIARSLASALTTNREPGSGTSSPRRTDVGGSRPAAATGYKDPSVEHGEEDKENIAGESGGNSTSSAPHVGNRQPEGRQCYFPNLRAPLMPQSHNMNEQLNGGIRNRQRSLRSRKRV